MALKYSLFIFKIKYNFVILILILRWNRTYKSSWQILWHLPFWYFLNGYLFACTDLYLCILFLKGKKRGIEKEEKIKVWTFTLVYILLLSEML